MAGCPCGALASGTNGTGSCSTTEAKGGCWPPADAVRVLVPPPGGDRLPVVELRVTTRPGPKLHLDRGPPPPPPPSSPSDLRRPRRRSRGGLFGADAEPPRSPQPPAARPCGDVGSGACFGTCCSCGAARTPGISCGSASCAGRPKEVGPTAGPDAVPLAGVAPLPPPPLTTRWKLAIEQRETSPGGLRPGVLPARRRRPSLLRPASCWRALATTPVHSFEALPMPASMRSRGLAAAVEARQGS